MNVATEGRARLPAADDGGGRHGEHIPAGRRNRRGDLLSVVPDHIVEESGDADGRGDTLQNHPHDLGLRPQGSLPGDRPFLSPRRDSSPLTLGFELVEQERAGRGTSLGALDTHIDNIAAGLGPDHEISPTAWQVYPPAQDHRELPSNMRRLTSAATAPPPKASGGGGRG